MTFISNLCSNPSFEVSLAGYTELFGTTLSQTSQNAYAGQYSMEVQTPGVRSGEGFLGPSVGFPLTSPAAVSVYLQGETGTVQVCAVTNPGGVVLASQTVQLSVTWQRVVLQGLSVPESDSLYLLVQTPTAQDLSFLVDAVQYEPETPAMNYIDGDSYGCNWLGTPGLSASEMPAQNPVILIGGLSLEGEVTVITPGQVSSFSLDGSIVSGGDITAVEVAFPQAAFDDFGMWKTTDPDPAQTYTSWNNAGELSGQTAYNRNWMIAYPPLDYPVSDGSLLWPRAAYMALGFEFASVGIGTTGAQNITSAQVELSPLAGNSDANPAPSTWDYPRSLHTIIKPTRLNYCPNPSMENSILFWVATGGATIVQDSSKHFGIEGEFDGVQIPQGQYSMKLTTAAITDTAQIQVPFLIYGNTYIASAYVLPGTAPAAVLGLTPLEGTILDQGTDTTDPDWLRPWIIFQAASSTVTLTISTTEPGTVNIDDVLIEQGEVLGAYFDGSFNDSDYMWESGGTEGLTRSYYYEGFFVGQSVVTDVISRQLPLGISAAEPEYAVPFTQ